MGPYIWDRILTEGVLAMSLRINDTIPNLTVENDSATVRSVFIIGPDKQLKLSMTYPMTVGRNFAEVLRALDGLQTSSGRGVATPANWNVGDDVIIPAALSDEDAKAKFGDFETVLPYLRKTKLS